MRICHVTRQFAPAVGGLESVVLNLAKAQIQAGHQVRVVTLNRTFSSREVPLPAREHLAGIEVIRIPFFGSRRYPIAPAVLRYIKNADVVHVHAIDFFFDFLALTSALHRRPLLVTPHGGFFHTRFAARLKTLYFHTVTRTLIKAYRAVVNVSHHDQELFRRIRARGMVWWNNGIDVEKFLHAGSPSPVKRLIAINRFSSNKRLDRLISFLAALRRHDSSWELVIAGDESHLSAADLRSLADQNGVGDAVDVIVRPSDEQLRRAISRCSVFASASEYEAFGLAAIEGLSAGLLPVLSNIPSFCDLVQSSEVGMVVDYDRPDHAAEMFLTHWANWSQHYGDRVQQASAAAARYDWKFVASSFDAVYERVSGHSVQRILGVDIHVMRQTEAIETLDRLSDGPDPVGVGFANAHALNVASSNVAVREDFSRLLILNDGIGVTFASRLLYRWPFPDNLNGTDFVPAYLNATRQNFKIFLLGSKPGVAEKAARTLAPPGGRHVIVGLHHGYFGPHRDADIAEQIKCSGADLLLVALGNPGQETWLSKNLEATGCRLAFAVGALFDFAAENVTRAPTWMRAYGLEWLYRLMQEPGRLWRRYLIGNWVFLGRVARQWWEGYRI